MSNLIRPIALAIDDVNLADHDQVCQLGAYEKIFAHSGGVSGEDRPTILAAIRAKKAEARKSHINCDLALSLLDKVEKALGTSLRFVEPALAEGGRVGIGV
ncbi:MAG TPA: hypothetical protein VGP13_02970 [Candidatus Paceibacterota bacterium]|nr:hypothetical protein [Candidatus Paceibacterota bacterium]